jgi:hypothetical protein
MRNVRPQRGRIAQAADQLPQLVLRAPLELALHAAEQQGHQIEHAVSRTDALAVDHPRDRPAVDQHVEMMEIQVRHVGGRQRRGGRRLPDRHDPVEQCGGSSRMRPHRVVQAVPVRAVQQRADQVGAPLGGTRLRRALQAVQRDQLGHELRHQPLRWPPRKELLHHQQNPVALGDQLIARRRVPAVAQHLHATGAATQPPERVALTALRLPPLEHAAGVTVRDDSGMTDLPARERRHLGERAAGLTAQGAQRVSRGHDAGSSCASARAARARWEIASFSPADISPTVRCSPSGTNAGS